MWRAYSSKLRHIDQTGQVLQVRALVIELAKRIVLLAITLSQRFEGFRVIRSCIPCQHALSLYTDPVPTSVHRTKHARDEAIDSPTLFDQGDERRYPTFVAG